MDTIRLFFRTNSFRNVSRKNETNLIEKDKLSRDNIKSLISSSSSSSLSSRSKLNSFQLETCSGLSIPLIIEPNIVASASESISNASSFTKERRHSWNVQHNISFHPSIRRTKSFYHTNRIKKERRIIEVNRSKKSVSFPLTTNTNNPSVSIPSKQTSLGGKTTITSNAFLTAASIFKYWVHLLKLFLLSTSNLSFFYKF